MDIKSTDILCPECNNKAEFLSDEEILIDCIWRPSKEGKIICLKCGLIKNSVFNQEMYYFQIPVRNSYLYARNRENLIVLAKYFDENLKMDDPNMDFPREFYINRVALIKSIDRRLKKELKV